jgi:ornithine cyclodeaminase
MTRFLDVSAVSTLIQSIGLGPSIAGIASYIESDYKNWSAFEKVPRVVNHSPTGVIELMPIADSRLYTFKYVNGHPQNTTYGLSTIMAFGVLAEVATGLPLLLSDLTFATALRTAATSALVARAVARKNSSSMAVIGCGGQSEFQIMGFHALMGIRRFQLFDSDPHAVEKVIRNLSPLSDLTIIAKSSVRDAVKGMDIITTITADKTKATIISADMLEVGMHINAVGGDCPGKTELHPDVLRNARVIVEYEPQTRIEGDIQQMPPDFPVTEIWKVLSGAELGRQSAGQITVFDSVGFALEDFSSLRYLHDMALKYNAGTDVGLIPKLSDPKDLYGLLQTLHLTMPDLMRVAEVVERQPSSKK